MENSQQHVLAPLDRSEAERRWATEPREVPHTGYQELQHRQPRPTEPVHNGMPSVPHAYMGASSPNGMEEERTTEMTRAGVQVELKKRKRVRHVGWIWDYADER